MIKAFVLRNSSKIFPDWKLWKPVVAACNTQMRRDFGPCYGLVPPIIEEFSDQAFESTEACIIEIMDAPDVPNAFGYHEDPPNAPPSIKVFIKPTLDNGGTLMTGPYSVSSTLSHEMIETPRNPNTNLVAVNYATGWSTPLEPADPVESDIYTIDGVDVSNFVLDPWYDAFAPAKSQFDFLHKLSKPYELSSGGYFSIIQKSGEETQVYGSLYPNWRKEIKQQHGRLALRNTRRKWETIALQQKGITPQKPLALV